MEDQWRCIKLFSTSHKQCSSLVIFSNGQRVPLELLSKWRETQICHQLELVAHGRRDRSELHWDGLQKMVQCVSEHTHD